MKVRDVLGRIKLECYPKTSGSRGMHIYVPVKPIYNYDDVAEFAEQIATVVARENSATATIERALSKRKKGQIYVDHMQNAGGKSVVAPYSVRPRAGATVSVPLDWREVERKKITPQDFTIKNMHKRLSERGDLFKRVLNGKQNLNDAIEETRESFEKSEACQKKT